jgi:hypothetical protein
MPRRTRRDSGDGGAGKRRRVLSDEQRRELLAQCRRATRPDPRPFRRIHGGWVSAEQQAENHREYEQAKAQAERDAQALFSERLKAIEAARS